jgi:hypothetical protein
MSTAGAFADGPVLGRATWLPVIRLMGQARKGGLQNRVRAGVKVNVCDPTAADRYGWGDQVKGTAGIEME